MNTNELVKQWYKEEDRPIYMDGIFHISSIVMKKKKICHGIIKTS